MSRFSWQRSASWSICPCRARANDTPVGAQRLPSPLGHGTEQRAAELVPFEEAVQARPADAVPVVDDPLGPVAAAVAHEEPGDGRRAGVGPTVVDLIAGDGDRRGLARRSLELPVRLERGAGSGGARDSPWGRRVGAQEG